MTTEELKPHNRQETLAFCRDYIGKFQEARSKKEKYFLAKIRGGRERQRARLPRLMRWLWPELTTEKMYFEIPVNRHGWSMKEYLEINFDHPLEPIQEIATLCERSDGENILLPSDLVFELEETRTPNPPQ